MNLTAKLKIVLVQKTPATITIKTPNQLYGVKPIKIFVLFSDQYLKQHLRQCWAPAPTLRLCPLPGLGVSFMSADRKEKSWFPRELLLTPWRTAYSIVCAHAIG